jgi:hypothetical protein
MPNSIVLKVIENPEMLLDRIDFAERQILFRQASVAALRSATFLDGRSEFWDGPSELVGLDAALAAAPGEPSPSRFIFHVGFCGSTLLARILDDAGGALVLKEPHCLVDIADHKAAAAAHGRDPELAPLLDLALANLMRSRLTGQPTLVKPTNWVNNLLPELAGGRAGNRAVFVTMAPAAFVRAVVRGGRDRLTFVARLAVHLAAGFPEGTRLLGEATRAGRDPLSQAVHLAALAFHMQVWLFDQAVASGDWPGALRLNFESIVSAPGEAALKASQALELELPEGGLRRSVALHGARNAKQPDAAFSTAARVDEDAAVDLHHGPTIAAALRWSETLPDAARVRAFS